MATISNSSVPHEVRTQFDPRAPILHIATVGEVRQVNNQIRTVRLDLDSKEKPPLIHLPGQYLDVHIPGLTNVGGFTITSPPSTTLVNTTGTGTLNYHAHLTLAIQSSPSNPAAEYFFSDLPNSKSGLIGTRLKIRVGGSFVYPPQSKFQTLTDDGERARRVWPRRVFIAGGVGINPIMSMLAHIAEDELKLGQPSENDGMLGVRVLYSARLNTRATPSTPSTPSTTTSTTTRTAASSQQGVQDGAEDEILFYQPLQRIASLDPAGNMSLSFFLTTALNDQDPNFPHRSSHPNTDTHFRRMTKTDILNAVGETAEERRGALVYVCGPPEMTDGVVGWLNSLEGFREDERAGKGRVMCEKWW